LESHIIINHNDAAGIIFDALTEITIYEKIILQRRFHQPGK
jgi:hypothetical protein